MTVNTSPYCFVPYDEPLPFARTLPGPAVGVGSRGPPTRLPRLGRQGGRLARRKRPASPPPQQRGAARAARRDVEEGEEEEEEGGERHEKQEDEEEEEEEEDAKKKHNGDEDGGEEGKEEEDGDGGEAEKRASASARGTRLAALSKALMQGAGREEGLRIGDRVVVFYI